MRRVMLLVVGALALALAVPGAASAHGRHHRHHHHAKAHHARTEHFGDSANTNPGGPADAGRVASFTDGVLTITLADGSTVSGNVTSDTEINCMGAGATASRDDQGDQGDRHGDQGDQGDQGDDQGGGDDQGDQQGQAPSCGTAQLVPGALVHEAILKIGSGGAQFKLVLLDEQQAAS